MTPALRKPEGPVRPRRRVGVRLWLGLAFAGVGIITGTSVYAFVSGSSEESARESSVEIAVGRTVRVADELGEFKRGASEAVLEDNRSEDFVAWAFDRRGRVITPQVVLGSDLAQLKRRGEAIRAALRGGRIVKEHGGDVTDVSVPVFRDAEIAGALLTRATRPAEVESALEAVREDRLTALAIAVAISVLIGTIVASLFTMRLKRLAVSAGQLAEGRLDTPLPARGRDEIGDLGRALESMRAALRGTVRVLSSERDRLSTILHALSEAVMVVSKNGVVRFSNPAAAPLIGADGSPIDAFGPWLRRAAQRGEASSDALRVGEHVYALQARELAAEDAVLLVVRDRTEELRREVAEREFISNAAHELRNPIAGISGAIEVLRAGAKDEPGALDHFLQRLNEDADRISRLTHSLLTLARIEAIGEREPELVDVSLATEEAMQALVAPDRVQVRLDVEPGIFADGDPALVRQILIALLTNAYKNTPPQGSVTLRARATGASAAGNMTGGRTPPEEGEVLIEVSDTGTGIPREERDRIFERFYRGRNSLEKEGFGLGLSIAQRMVEAMGGEIGVHSELGKGSTFWVRLRAARTAPTPVA
ncbi:MAG TPA: ATP-binding protein [Solirubrobacterales bacterium]|nr:ATP-binding protein [Solirubrobacterales bacterium]